MSYLPDETLMRMKAWKASQLLDQGRLHRSCKVMGMPTGIANLDATSRGLPVGLVLLAGRPESGHRALARQIALNIVQASNLPVIWFSTQFNAEELVGQLLLHEGADQVLADSHSFVIIDAPRLTMRGINDELNDVFELGKDGRGLIVVDDLELLLKSHSKRSASRHELASELRCIAVARNSSMMACCGLSRKLEEREDKLPRLSDLKAVMPFVLGADQVIATHYPYYYEPELTSKDAWEILLLKNRNGPTGSVIGTTAILPWLAC